MSIFRRRAGATCALVLLTLRLSAPALAQSDLVVTYAADTGAVTKSLPVDVSDIRLSSAAGRAVLERRVTAAAKVVCGHNAIYGLRGPRDYETCFTAAKAKGLADANVVQTASR